jgi:hypothetical protein
MCGDEEETLDIYQKDVFTEFLKTKKS